MKKKKSLILVIDDNANNVQFLSNLLSKNGFNPAAALSGEEGLNFVTNNKPDLILLDIMMPGIDGFEVCKKLKLDLSTKDIPVIFLTAQTDTEHIVKGFESGGVDYVTKPFNSRELMARVKTHVEMKILRGLVSICGNCKKIRNDSNSWQDLEDFVQTHSQVSFSHGLCAECMDELYGKFSWYKEGKKDKDDKTN